MGVEQNRRDQEVTLATATHTYVHDLHDERYTKRRMVRVSLY